MSDYIENPTQEERIIALLRERGSEGAFVWDFTMPRNKGGLGCMQYNARVWGLRQKGYVIENVKPGHFVLKEEPKPVQNNFL